MFLRFEFFFLIFTPQDSFGLRIKAKVGQQEDVFDTLSPIFDFSNYPTTSPKYSKQNASKLGYWKDEVKILLFQAFTETKFPNLSLQIQGGRMKEFVGLRSKTYAFMLKEEGGKDDVLRSKCKGVTRGYKKTLNFQDFKRCVETFSRTTIKQYHIRSTNHIVKTLKVHKTCFSSFDDKRYLYFCGVHSSPYGSKLIKQSGVNKCPFC